MRVEIIKTDAKHLDLPSTDSAVWKFLLRCSALMWEGRVDGKMVCVWGLVPPTLLSEQAYLWLHTDDERVRDHQFLFVRHSQMMIDEMLKDFPLIVGHCSLNEPRSIRWLKWLGATFGSPSAKSVPFEIRRKHEPE